MTSPTIGPFSAPARRALAGAALIAFAAAPAGAPAGSGGDVTGIWVSGSDKVAVEIYPCAEAMCGRIAWLAHPYRKTGELKRDANNPDPALRRRGWCGIEVISGLRPAADGRWTGGRIYYPKDGNTYDLDVTPRDGALELRAYVGLPLLGRTATWTRAAPGDPAACPSAAG